MLGKRPERWLSLATGLAILAMFPLRVAIANTAGWRSMAAWLAG